MRFLIALLVLVVGFFENATANESNQPPVAVQTSDPSQNWFFESESIVFSSSSSYDPDGYIAERKWYINGVYQSASTTLSKCFVLFGTTGTSCYQLGSGVTSVSIKLEVKDNAGEWRSSTVSYTIRAEKARRYFVTDHLGSVRTTVDRDGNVLGYDDYYPFGLAMPGRSVNTANPDDNYKFTGHERDEEAGLTLDYMNARNYDPILGRFLQIDPHYFKYPSWSPYTYVYNNPLLLTDPSGMDPECRTIKAKNTYRECTFNPPRDYGPVGNTVIRTETAINRARIGFEMRWVAVEGAVKEFLERKVGIEFNAQMGKEAERLVTRELVQNADGAVVNQVMGQFEDGTKVVFDNIVLDENGNIVLVNETKYNEAKLSKQQKRFFEKKESVTLIGKNATEGGIDGRVVDPNTVPTKKTTVEPDQIEARLYIDEELNLIYGLDNLEIRFIKISKTG